MTAPVGTTRSSAGGRERLEFSGEAPGQGILVATLRWEFGVGVEFINGGLRWFLLVMLGEVRY